MLTTTHPQLNKYGKVNHKEVYWNLLFVIYINKLASINSSATFFVYADDTTSFFLSQGVTQVATTGNKDLITLDIWSRNNALKVNVTKT